METKEANTCTFHLTTNHRKDGKWSALGIVRGPQGSRTEIRHTGCHTQVEAESLVAMDAHDLMEALGWEEVSDHE